MYNTLLGRWFDRIISVAMILVGMDYLLSVDPFISYVCIIHSTNQYSVHTVDEKV